jgi:hypothetical protein
MYYLVYRQWTKWQNPDIIETKRFQSEDKLSKFLNTLDEDKENDWLYTIILLVKGDRMQPFKQNVYGFKHTKDKSVNTKSFYA